MTALSEASIGKYIVIYLTIKRLKLLRGSKFNIKDVTKIEHKRDVIYRSHLQCLLEACDKSYNGETRRRIAERFSDHSDSDKAPTCINISSRKTMQL